jgi:hypothetical protein
VTRGAALLLLVAACGDNVDTPPLDAAVDPEAQFDDTDAWVEVSLRSGSISVTGNTITDPALWPYGEPSREGACRMWTRAIEICDPFCDFTQTCVAGQCLSSPAARSAGTLTVSGGGESRTVPYRNNAYLLFEQTEPFQPGDEITVSAPGDVVGAFSASAVAPRPLDLTSPDPNVRNGVVVGEPFAITWTPADPGSRVRLTLGADFGHGQHRPVVIECDAPDEAGRIDVPQGMVDELADPSHWACGICIGQEAKRYARSRTTAGALPLTLWVIQRTGFDLRPG